MTSHMQPGGVGHATCKHELSECVLCTILKTNVM